MFPALLTTVFFSLSVIFAARSARILGGPRANAARLTLALLLLAFWAHWFGQGLSGASLNWFLVSGFVGFGIGDVALFGALPRIGPRLSILLTQCLAAPLAALVEWGWLGTSLRPAELLCTTAILLGVVLALAPDHGWPIERRVFWAGVLWGIGSACGQAGGAVLSRKANLVALWAGETPVDGGTAAYQRILGGIVVTWLAWLLAERRRRSEGLDPGQGRTAAWLILGNTLAGPVIGVACFQWALQATASGIVLPIVATSPLVTMLFTYFLDGQRPSRRVVAGGLIAVSGAVCLKLVQLPVAAG